MLLFLCVKEAVAIEKIERIEIRVSRAVKQQLMKQAAKHNMSLSAYMLYTALHQELALELPDSPAKRSAQLHTRLSPAVKERLLEKVKLTGMSTGAVIEAALREQKIYAVDMKEMARQTGKLGNNINQLAMLAHEGKIHAVNLLECKKLLEQNLDEMLQIRKMLKEKKK